MKLSQFKQFLIPCVGLLLITFCGGNNASRATGWDINSKSGGFQFNVEFEDQETGPGLVFVEGVNILPKDSSRRCHARLEQYSKQAACHVLLHRRNRGTNSYVFRVSGLAGIRLSNK